MCSIIFRLRRSFTVLLEETLSIWKVIELKLEAVIAEMADNKGVILPLG